MVREYRVLLIVVALVAAFGGLSLVQAKSPSANGEAQRLRELRQAFNVALAARDPSATLRYMSATAVILASDGVVLKGGKAIADSYASEEYADPDFIAYDRQPEVFEIAPGGRFAVERGRWRGRFRSSQGGEEGSAGLYQAGWVRAGREWRIQTEAYVRLTCRYPSDCK